jgi:biopolymer transport protein ExbD
VSSHATNNAGKPGEPVYTGTRRKKKRGGGEEEEAHGELNLTAMIDMMTILLVFLLKSYSISSTNIDMNNLTLPKATSPEAIVEATKITLTTKAILVDEKPIGIPTGGKLSLEQTTQGLMFPKALLDPKDDHRVPLLEARLKESAEKQRKLLEKQKKELHSKILIIADSKIPFITIAQVIRTVGLVTIVVKNPDGSPKMDATGKPAEDGWFDEYRFVVVTTKKE